jgi:protein-disulfide isomerase
MTITGMNRECLRPPAKYFVSGRAAILLLATLLTAASAATTDIVEGNPSSTVKVTIFEDLQCNYCQTFRTMLDEKLLPRYGAKVAFIHRDMPLGRHEWARPAAMAARWASEQSLRVGINFRRELMAEQEHMTLAALKPWVMEFAKRNNLSESAIAAALTDQRLAALVDQDIQIATARGVTKIPAIYVAGQSFIETVVYDDLARAIDNALAR